MKALTSLFLVGVVLACGSATAVSQTAANNKPLSLRERAAVRSKLITEKQSGPCCCCGS
jgi:hypothetical protein